MTSPGDMPDSAEARRIALRMRPDLSIHPQRIGQHRHWVVKDPVALTYFHLRDEEHAILQMLDGRASLAEIKRRFEHAFAPMQISFEQIQGFLARLYDFGLLLAEAPGQGRQLLSRFSRRRRTEVIRSLTGVLAIRFQGIDPEPILGWLYPKCSWMFSRWCLLAGILLATAAATLVTVQFDVLQSKLPDYYAFFTLRNVVWMAVAMATAKVLHELGHALTCKHFDGECHEMGIMLLVFTPCLFCNVSDSWMLKSKWKRIAVTAAGMYVEIVLASVCTFLWWFSEPGLLNTICLNTMFVCSVSTVLFNGNPLLRYDGYFVLSDLVEVPNLAQQSRAVVSRAAAMLLLGMKPSDNRALPDARRGLLAAYGIASTLYRWAIVVVILWFCAKTLRPYGLEVLAQVLMVGVIGGMLAVPVRNTVSALRNPSWRGLVRPRRVALTCAGLGLAAAAAWLVPLPASITAPAVLQPEAAHHVYVPDAGKLVRAVPVGTTVKKGDLLAELEDYDVLMEVEKLSGSCNRQRKRLENLKYQLVSDPGIGPQIPAAEEALADLEKRLHQRRRDRQRLLLTASVPGVVLPAARLPRQPPTRGQLQTWWGNPLEQHNLGCRLETGTTFCLVGTLARFEAVLAIDQSNVTFVRKGQRVRIQLDELPGKILHGTIREIAKIDLKVVPRELAFGEALPARVDEHGVPRPTETSYHARVSLDDHPPHLLTGSLGRAKILADPQPLLRRFSRYLKRTFRFEF